VLVIGAGAMSGLAVATAARSGAASITVCSRTMPKAERLAASVRAQFAGVTAVVVPASELTAALPGAAIVFACAGAPGYLVTSAAAQQALSARSGQPQVYLDLAVPRDVEPAIDALPGAHVVDLELLGRDLSSAGLADVVAQARELVDGEVASYLAVQRAQDVAPTVVALRAMARSVVESELARLESRLGGADPAVRAEVEQTVHRVVEKLLHAPTVRMKELAAEPGGSAYAQALRTLFDLGAEPEGSDVTPTLDGRSAEPGIEIAMTLTRGHSAGRTS
jgi:glutamyl-tRNA reductase